MIRTTLTLPNFLHKRAKIAAEHENTPLGVYLQHLIDEALVVQEKDRIKRMHKDLAQLDGIGPDDVTDASITINETLYGEPSAQ